MRRFNPEKELYKIQHGNRNKIMLFVFLLLVVSVISYSFALYQVRYSKRIIYTKVAPFSSKDIDILAVYLDNQPTTGFPKKNSGYRYDKIVCDNGGTATFDNINWELVLRAKDKDKCSVYFVKTYKDASGANAPELYQGLIPVTYDSSGNVKVADIDTEWYNYDDQRWANAVLVDSSNYGKYVENDKYKSATIPMTEILQMYVWIPRYKYQLFNVDNQGIDPQEIQIQFENNTSTTGTVSCNTDAKGKETCTGATKGAWYTHPAFKFGNTQLTGIWMGKFESSGNNTNIKIVPNATPLFNVNISYMFNASRNIELQYSNKYNIKSNEIDIHMMKNMEWGAMAYLTQSKYGRCDGKGTCTEVTMNNRSGHVTGYDNTNSLWNTSNGQKASTTGNMYGIYDTNGGAWEYAMANMVTANGEFYQTDAGFSSKPNQKYYDIYEYSVTVLDQRRGHLGDATRETLQSLVSGNAAGGWYGDYSWFPIDSGQRSWFTRSGGVGYGDVTPGIFAYANYPGKGNDEITFRVILTAQDGNE